jgi:hypothetical protein
MGQARKNKLNLIRRQSCQRLRRFNGQHLPDFLYSLCESDIVRHSVILMMTGDLHYSLYPAHRQHEEVMPYILRLEIPAPWCDAVHALRGIKHG